MQLHIEGIWIRNFQVHKLLGLGSCFPRVTVVSEMAEDASLAFGPLTVLAGKNGTGKNSVFDAIQFVSDTLHYNVERACLKRGGFQAIHTIGSPGPITVGLACRLEGDETQYTYAISVQCAKDGQPFVETEILAAQGEKPTPILLLQNNPRLVRHIAEADGLERSDVNAIEFCDYRHLGLGAMVYHPQYPILAAVRQTLENWYLSDFTVDVARDCSPAVVIKPPNPRGSTLASLLRYYAENFTERFFEIISSAGRLVPGVREVRVMAFREGVPQLGFELTGQEGVVSLGQMSSSALRLFTYGLLSVDPSPAPLLVLVHPENGLDRTNCLRMSRFLETLSSRPEATSASQTFLSTNNASLLGALKPEQIWLMSLDAQGYSVAQRACDTAAFQATAVSGEPLPQNWFGICFADAI